MPLFACTAPERATPPDNTPVLGGGGSGGGPPGTISGGAGGDSPAPGGGGATPGMVEGTGGTDAPDAEPDVPVVTLLAAGAVCAQDVECQSGFCTDKVCCATRCDGTCRSCAITGSLGTCLPADVGTDPRDDCPDETPARCGRDGACDGSGECRKYPSGTICQAATCTGSTLTAASRCGAQACAPVTGQPCAPFMCGTMAACLTSCKVNTECVAPNVCVAGRCGKKPLGDRCAADDECNSRHCAQGVCCGTTCSALCNSCALRGSEGRCTPVPPGQDPLLQCTREDPTTCGLDGACDGQGACGNWVEGTICKPAACMNATQTPAAICNGTGDCGSSTEISCGDYACDTNARCRVSCTRAADCVAPAICASGGVCGGILAQYFSDMTLTNLVLTRTEAQINNVWGLGGPPGVPTDMFSARFTGTITPRFSELYTIYANADDGVRVWINDAPIIDNFLPHPVFEDSGIIALRAGVPASIRVEYFEKTLDAILVVSWSSPSEPKAVIPTVRLSPRM